MHTQLWYTVSGTYNHNINGVSYNQTAGSLILVPPFAVHSVDLSETHPDPLRLIKVTIFSNLFSEGIMPYTPLSYTTAVFDGHLLPLSLTLYDEDKERADMLFEEMLSEYSLHHDMNITSIYGNIEKTFRLIAEKTKECGFCDPTHLSHTIKRLSGTSPLLLRAKLIEHDKTYGLQGHLLQMEKLAWMDALSADEIISEIAPLVFQQNDFHCDIFSNNSKSKIDKVRKRTLSIF